MQWNLQLFQNKLALHTGTKQHPIIKIQRHISLSLGGIHKLRWQTRRELVKHQQHYIRLCSKIDNEAGGGLNTPPNHGNVIYGWPLIIIISSSFSISNRLFRTGSLEFVDCDILLSRKLYLHSDTVIVNLGIK